jgi:hypothetical protein
MNDNYRYISIVAGVAILMVLSKMALGPKIDRIESPKGCCTIMVTQADSSVVFIDRSDNTVIDMWHQKDFVAVGNVTISDVVRNYKQHCDNTHPRR